MEWFKATLTVATHGKGLYNVTPIVEQQLRQWGIAEGMCFLYIPHASASLVVSESYDPTARHDLEVFLERLVPEGEPWYTHDFEGSDDAPSHLRAALTHQSLSIPIDDHRLQLGTWQGLFLFEHRRRGHQRRLLVRALKVT